MYCICRLAVLIGAGVVLAGSASADDDTRVKIAGLAVLRVATALATDGDRWSSPCRIAAEWSTATIPRDIARKVLGLKLNADLAAGSPVPDSYATLSSVEPDPSRICSMDDIHRQYEAARVTHTNETSFSYHVGSYTYPVFNLALTRAVFVWTDIYSNRFFGENAAKPGGISFTVTALTFGKGRHGWTVIAQDVIGQT